MVRKLIKDNDKCLKCGSKELWVEEYKGQIFASFECKKCKYNWIDEEESE